MKRLSMFLLLASLGLGCTAGVIGDSGMAPEPAEESTLDAALPDEPDADIDPLVDASEPTLADATIEPEPEPTVDAAPVDEQALLLQQLSPNERDLLIQVNNARALRALPALTVRADLDCAAKKHANDVGPVDQCSHTGTDGTTYQQRVAACGGTNPTGEVISCRSLNAVGAMGVWDNDAPSTATIGKPEHTRVGVAMASNYWVVVFGN